MPALDADGVDRASARGSATAEDVYRALIASGPVEDEGALAAIKARIRRSLDDPRPNLSLDQVDAFIGELVARAKADSGRA